VTSWLLFSVKKEAESWIFAASNRTLLSNGDQNYSGSNGMRDFIRAVDCHRSGQKASSPFLSAFSDRQEADSWIFAASRFHGSELHNINLLMINTSKKPQVPMWNVEDIKRQTNLQLNPQNKDLNMRHLRILSDDKAAQSECLI
jgi:hypothetical protein